MIRYYAMTSGSYLRISGSTSSHVYWIYANGNVAVWRIGGEQYEIVLLADGDCRP